MLFTRLIVNLNLLAEDNGKRKTPNVEQADEAGYINVPDYLDPLINYVGNQIRFHTISGKNEIQTVCDIVAKAEQFFNNLKECQELSK